MQRKQILVLIFLMTGAITLFGQDSQTKRSTARERLQQKAATQHQMQKQYPTGESMENVKWSRTIYRYLNLTKEANSPLYYPVAPTDGKASLFTILFKLLQDDNIPAYEYLDGREEFTEEYKINFLEWLERFDIYHEITNGKVTVNDADIPGNEVTGYYIKEIYYFDTPSSSFVVKPLALCPILQQRDDYGNITRYPLFWVPYNTVAPYTRRAFIMSSSLNNSEHGTIDDFFRLRKYDGEIYKAQNARNLSISQYTSTPEELKAEQERIEQELVNFEQMVRSEDPIPSQTIIPQKKKRNKKRGATSSNDHSSVSMRDRRY